MVYALPAAPGPDYVWMDGDWVRAGVVTTGMVEIGNFTRTNEDGTGGTGNGIHAIPETRTTPYLEGFVVQTGCRSDHSFPERH